MHNSRYVAAEMEGLLEPDRLTRSVRFVLITPRDGRSAAPEQELEILGSERFHGSIIRVDRRVDHVGFLLLKKNHTTLD